VAIVLDEITSDWDASVGLIPEHSFTTSTGYDTLISTGESGKERRRSKRSIQQREWKLVFNVLTKAEADLIWSFYQSQKGAYGAFTWQDPVTTLTHNVRFKDDTLSRDYFTSNFYKLSFDLIEIL